MASELLSTSSLPAAWQKTTLGNVADFINGDRGKNYPSQSDRVATGIPFINTGHIDPNGRLSHARMDFITRARYDKLGSGKVKPGDIVYCLRGSTIGKTARNHYEEGAIASSLAIVRAKPEAVQDFLYYFLVSPIGQQMATEHDNGSAQPNLSAKAISQYPLLLPPIAEQKAIAHILGTLDDKIELNRQMNATLEAMAQALFKSWFVDFDPVIDNALAAGNPIPEPLQPRAEARAALGDQRKPLPEAIQKQFPDRFVFNEEMGWVPEGWGVRTLDEVTTELRRGVSPKYTEEGGVRVVNQKCIRDHSVNYELTRRNDPAKRKIEGREIEIGDVLVNSTGVGTLGRMAQVFDLDETTVVDSHVTVVRPNTETYQPFVFGQLMLSMEPTVESMGEGTTGQTELSRANLQALKLLVPPLDSQEFVEQRLSAFAKRRVSASRENGNLVKLRDTLLPKLLSGQLRIPDAEKQLAEAL